MDVGRWLLLFFGIVFHSSLLHRYRFYILGKILKWYFNTDFQAPTHSCCFVSVIQIIWSDKQKKNALTRIGASRRDYFFNNVFFSSSKLECSPTNSFLSHNRSNSFTLLAEKHVHGFCIAENDYLVTQTINICLSETQCAVDIIYFVWWHWRSHRKKCLSDFNPRIWFKTKKKWIWWSI